MSLWKKQNLGPRKNRIVDKQRLEEEHPRKINVYGLQSISTWLKYRIHRVEGAKSWRSYLGLVWDGGNGEERGLYSIIRE